MQHRVKELAAATVCEGGVGPASDHCYLGVSVEMHMAVKWECLYSREEYQIEEISLIFKEAASNFRKSQPKDIFTLAVHLSLSMI